MAGMWFPFVVERKAFGTEELGTLFAVMISIGVVTVIAGGMLVSRYFVHQLIHFHQVVDDERWR